MEGNNIKIGDKLYAVSCIDWSDFEIGEWIVEDSYDMAGIRMFRCRKCGELDEYLYFSSTSDDWIMRGGDDAEYVAFSQNDRELLYNYLVNRAEFEKLRIEKEIGLLTSKLNNLNQNIKSARELHKRCEKATIMRRVDVGIDSDIAKGGLVSLEELYGHMRGILKTTESSTFTEHVEKLMVKQGFKA